MRVHEIPALRAEATCRELVDDGIVRMGSASPRERVDAVMFPSEVVETGRLSNVAGRHRGLFFRKVDT